MIDQVLQKLLDVQQDVIRLTPFPLAVAAQLSSDTLLMFGPSLIFFFTACSLYVAAYVNGPLDG